MAGFGMDGGEWDRRPLTMVVKSPPLCIFSESSRRQLVSTTLFDCSFP